MVHAAGESAIDQVPVGTYAIVLATDRAGLEELERMLLEESVPHAAIRENWEPYNGQLMAIGLTPAPKSEVKRYVSSLPLLK